MRVQIGTLLIYAMTILTTFNYSDEEDFKDVDVLILPSSTLSPKEACDVCQVALRTIYGHFGANVPSRRKLVHQLKHECKRHFNYRRRCLLLAKQHSEMVFREMTGGSFKPINACLVMKECKTLDSPISADFTVALLPESEDYIEIETTVQPQ